MRREFGADDALREGRRAWEEQRPLAANPFRTGTPEHEQWEQGWRAAARASLVLEDAG